MYTIGVWDAANGGMRLHIGADGDLVRASVALTDADARWILSAGPWMRVIGDRSVIWRGGILRIWETGGGLERFRFVNDASFAAMGLDENFDHVALIDVNGEMMLVKVDVERNIWTEAKNFLRPQEEFELVSQLRVGVGVGFSADVHRAVAVARKKDSHTGVLLYDIRAEKIRFQPASAYCDAIGSAPVQHDRIGGLEATLSADGRIIALRLAARPTRVDLFDFDTDAHLGELALEEGDGVELMQFDEAGRHLAVATAKGPVRIFDLATSKQVAVGDGAGIGPVWAMRFASSKLHVLSGAEKEMNRREYEAAQARGEDLPKIQLWSVPLPH